MKITLVRPKFSDFKRLKEPFNIVRDLYRYLKACQHYINHLETYIGINNYYNSGKYRYGTNPNQLKIQFKEYANNYDAKAAEEKRKLDEKNLYNSKK